MVRHPESRKAGRRISKSRCFTVAQHDNHGDPLGDSYVTSFSVNPRYNPLDGS